jgi:Na+/H+-dicarboxylate symporter
VTEGGLVTPALANVVLPMGANVNMDGSAISFPCAILFLANSDSLVGTMTAFTWINIALCCSLGSVGAAPVPSAGMVTLITVWQTVFPSHDVPEAIAYVQVSHPLSLCLTQCRPLSVYLSQGD